MNQAWWWRRGARAVEVAVFAVFVAGLVAVFVVVAGCAPAARPESVSAPVTCDQVRVPVLVSAAGSTSPTLAGQLCHPAGDLGSVVEVLIPGSTYNHAYWDFPVPSYSYARAHAARGFATLAIDRLNTGASSSIDPGSLTIEVDAACLHQVIAALRAGTVTAGHAFAKVITVGHSLGSVIALAEAGTYRDVDGLVLSGLTHTQNPAVQFAHLVHPANQADPSPSRFLPGKPAGEVTTLPGVRGRYFYDPADADPRVIEADEASKDTVAVAESAAFASTLAGPASGHITAPVLLAVGQHDALFTCAGASCADDSALRAAEAARFAAAASFQPFVLAGSGHDLNLASNHQQFYDTTIDWMDNHFRHSN